MSASRRRPRLDSATVAAAGLVAYVLVAVVHEALGHGVACLAVAGYASAVSTTELRCDGVAGMSAVIVTAAGRL